MKIAYMCVALVLEEARALILDQEQGGRRQVNEVDSGAGSAVAMCLSGNARSFPEPRVLNSWKRFVSSNRERSQLDVFAHLTLEGAGPKGHQRFNFPGVHVSQREVEAALESLTTTAHTIEVSSDTVNSSNLHEYVAHEECFNAGFYHNSRDHLIRSCNQFLHIQKCLRLIEAHEQERELTYGTVIVARPDLMYSKGCDWNSKVDFNLVESGSTVYHYDKRDFLLVMPRRAAADLAAVLPLQVSPGQKCCGHLRMSEEIFEYMLGFPTRSHCSIGIRYDNEIKLDKRCFKLARPAHSFDR